MNLTKMLSIAGVSLISPKDLPVEKVVCHSDAVGEKTLFVCHRGHIENGEAYALSAYEKGARLFLSSHPLPLPADAVCLVSSTPERDGAKLACALTDNVQNRLTFIGITGTKGKTTVATFLYRILTSRGIFTALIGTGGMRFERQTVTTRNTTPDIYTMLPFLQTAYARGCTHVVMEVSSQALADGRMDELPMTGAVLTSLGVDHIGKNEHPTLAAYYAAKRRLFCDFSPRFCVYNPDSAAADNMTRALPRISCSATQAADVRAHLLSLSETGTEYEVNGQWHRLLQPGAYSVTNALLAAKTADLLGVGCLQENLSAMADCPVEGRLRIWTMAGRQIWLDYAHNAMSFRSVGRTAKSLSRGRVLAVFGSVADRGFDRRKQLSVCAEEIFDFSILTEDSPGEESAADICREMASYFHARDKLCICPRRADAVRLAAALSLPSDTVLLLGKGDETYTDSAGNVVFDEKIINIALKKRKTP